ncbi:MAG: hypothetical protein AABZ39_19405 [Spirochaetota bacterium]
MVAMETQTLAAWKNGWDDTRAHYLKWWSHTGHVVVAYGKALYQKPPHEGVARMAKASSLEQQWLDPVWRAAYEESIVAAADYPFDNLPIAHTSIGPGSLALYLGSEAALQDHTVWYDPCITDPEHHPALRFDPNNRYWKIHEAIIRENLKRSCGRYFIACPDIIENIDVLASLRDAQTLLMDMVDRPSWIKERVAEINEAYFETYDRVYDMIKLPDGSSVYGHFHLWGPGKTIKVQCDASAMFSPDMFNEFVTPQLTEQCEWCDHSLYHLDGPDAICHLDNLLAIKPLDAIQWIPGAGKPDAGQTLWYPMYEKILGAGKSLQIAVQIKDLKRTVDAIGSTGVFWQVFGVETEEDIGTVRTLLSR